jgi:alpha-L-glutamate ligase-like protein
MWWQTAKTLAEKGVLGINQRNADFIMRYNKREFFPLVDDKLSTKELALKKGVAVPELYACIEIQRQIEHIDEILKPFENFVVKPSRGSGGEGIIVVVGRTKNGFRKASGSVLKLEELKHHLSMILGGIYSLGGHPDKALIEYLVHFDPIFQNISYLGVPDIRIIVFLGVPVMAMIRLPTRKSDGKANLHQGAIGAGISIQHGRTTTAVSGNSSIEEHPDTGAPVTGVQIPHWEKLLEIAAKSYEMTGLGYQGVDMVLDKDRGPLLLELNARPGLNIQLANMAGLLPRLRLVEEKVAGKGFSPDERIAFAKENFF